jgi:hypothetical protein
MILPKNPAAQALGRLGGLARSARKREAAKVNLAIARRAKQVPKEEQSREEEKL